MDIATIRRAQMKKCFKNFKYQNKKGFTLLELLIVIVILGALAALAIPAYTSTVERSRRQEAIQVLSAVKDAQQRFFMGSATYTAVYTQLDFDPQNIAIDPPGTVRHFAYAAPTATATTWSVVATRNAIDRPTGVAAYTVTMDQTGAITATG